VIKLKEEGFRLLDCRQAGYGMRDLVEAYGCSGVCKDFGYASWQLREAGFSAAELRFHLHRSRASLVAAGYTLQQLVDADFSSWGPSTFRRSGFSLEDLVDLGWTLPELVAVGYRTTKLQKAGFSLQKIEEAEQNARDLAFAARPATAPAPACPESVCCEMEEELAFDLFDD